MTIDDVLAAASVIPVLELPSLDLAAPLAEALAEGGLTVVELTLRTDCALESIAVMKAAGPGLIIGMGTIRARDDVRASLESGADFLVSPGTDPNLLEALSEFGAPALPGVATASEAMGAQAAGFSALKFFSCRSGGRSRVSEISCRAAARYSVLSNRRDWRGSSTNLPCTAQRSMCRRFVGCHTSTDSRTRVGCHHGKCEAGSDDSRQGVISMKELPEGA